MVRVIIKDKVIIKVPMFIQLKSLNLQQLFVYSYGIKH